MTKFSRDIHNPGFVRAEHLPSETFSDTALVTDASVPLTVREAAARFLGDVFDEYTPDAMDQLVEVFVPCLRIMCERPWSPDGATWKKSGIFGVMTDAKKKWERFWERTWVHGVRHDDSGYDHINYVGMVLRADPNSGWGEWGDPHSRKPEDI
jgi:hypothetical protein